MPHHRARPSASQLHCSVYLPLWSFHSLWVIYPLIGSAIRSTIVTPDAVRTAAGRYMLAIVTGKWVVDAKWVRQCADLGEIPDEAEFSPVRDAKCVVGKSPTASVENRAAGNPLLFDGCVFSFVGGFADYSGLPADKLKQLVQLGGGKIVEAIHRPCMLPRVVPFHCTKRKGRLQCIFEVSADADTCSILEDGVAEVTQDFLLDCISRFEITAL